MIEATLVGRADILAAWDRISSHVRRTPVIEVGAGAFGLDVPIAIKLELLQHTGSFKPRGAFNRMLTADIDETGVLAASGGNFGLAVAYAAHRLGHPAEIFVPSTSPPMKIERIRSYGATVHVVDGFYAQAFAACEERAFDTGAAFLHPYDQPAVVAGQGTLAQELGEQEPTLDTVIVAVGGVGDGESEVPARRRKHPRLVDVGREHPVERTARFEGARVLQQLQLEDESPGDAEGASLQFDDRRAPHPRPQEVARALHVETGHIQRLLARRQGSHPA